jgi:hypothetical protein
MTSECAHENHQNKQNPIHGMVIEDGVVITEHHKQNWKNEIGVVN